MATVTEKQEAVKEILGSTESIRRFVQDEDIHLEELRGYISKLESVVKALEETKKQEAIDSVKAKMEAFRAELALSGLEKPEIDKLLGIATASTKTSSKPSEKIPTVKAPRNISKYIFPLGDDTFSEPTATVGKKSPDSDVMKACKALGYKNLGEWVKADNFKTIQKA